MSFAMHYQRQPFGVTLVTRAAPPLNATRLLVVLELPLNGVLLAALIARILLLRVFVEDVLSITTHINHSLQCNQLFVPPVTSSTASE